ncbi:MAG: hypothetical protein NVSMB9_17700 [Isosphaeraceae bacterium]
MGSQQLSGRASKHIVAVALRSTILTLSMSVPVEAKLETWREETATAFNKGHRERVVVSDNGRVRLGHALKPLDSVKAARVWDLARGPKSELFAATGDDGKVFKHDAGEGHSWTIAYKANDTQVLSLVQGPEGHIFAGTGPSGQLVDVTDPKHPATRPHSGVQYIWDLAADPKGNIFAATGPTGQLWKRSIEGVWSLLYDSKHSHLLCVAVSPDGSVIAGSDGEGLIYKVTPGGKVSVLYDAPQNEVRSLVVSPRGIVYAGTAAESSGGSSRGHTLFSGGELTISEKSNGEMIKTKTSVVLSNSAETRQKADAPAKEEKQSRSTTAPKGGSAAPKPVQAGENSVYRIDSDGVAREIFRAKVMIFALALRNDHVLAGTGPEGQLYVIHEDEHETASLARLDNGQILALLSDPEGGLLIGTGDPASVVRLDLGHVSSGTLLSDVRDAKLTSRLGAVGWRADQPPGTSVSLQVRSGNVAEPDSTWSDWSQEQLDPTNAQAHTPSGRFFQYRVKLATRDPSLTPELHEVFIRYQSTNLPPEVTKLEVPDVTTLDGSTRQTRMTLRWEVSDPNDDELNYTLQLRKTGWPDWVNLNERPISEKTYAWDTTSVPPGTYRVRLIATDRPSNSASDALTREKTSETFIVDHEGPEVTLKTTKGRVSAALKDKLTRVVKASYALDGGDWVPVFPDDGLFDTPEESVSFSLSEMKTGTHVLVLRATDAAGNVGSGDLLIDVR